jgi:hypothetical protein
MGPLIPFLVPLESPWCVNMQPDDFVSWKLMMLQLLNIELFLSLKIQHKITTKSLKKIRASSHSCWKALDEWNFLEMIFWFWKLMQGYIEFGVIFVTLFIFYFSPLVLLLRSCWHLKQLYNDVHTWANCTCHTSLSSNEGSLFASFFFPFPVISQTIAPIGAHLVLMESPWHLSVH